MYFRNIQSIKHKSSMKCKFIVQYMFVQTIICMSIYRCLWLKSETMSLQMDFCEVLSLVQIFVVSGACVYITSSTAVSLLVKVVDMCIDQKCFFSLELFSLRWIWNSEKAGS